VTAGKSEPYGTGTGKFMFWIGNNVGLTAAKEDAFVQALGLDSSVTQEAFLQNPPAPASPINQAAHRAAYDVMPAAVRVSGVKELTHFGWMVAEATFADWSHERYICAAGNQHITNAVKLGQYSYGAKGQGGEHTEHICFLSLQNVLENQYGCTAGQALAPAGKCRVRSVKIRMRTEIPMCVGCVNDETAFTATFTGRGLAVTQIAADTQGRQ